MKDLIVLVADRDMEAGVKSILKRHKSLKIRPVKHDIFIHPEHEC